MKKLIAGNWKMNGTQQSSAELATIIGMEVAENKELLDSCDFVVCPPHPYLHIVNHSLKGTGASVALGAQDCAQAEEGAYTGDISVAMAQDIGASYVILGHSERRQYHQETDAAIAVKASLAHKQGLVAIICVGETDEQREQGVQENIVGGQLDIAIPDGATSENTVIAYEPVWAIGTGKTATPDDVKAMHLFIRHKLKEKLADSESVRILYGGSVKPENAKELFQVDNVNGALIGGASLKAEMFIGIAKAA